jgi:IS605 OrfB family transposase
LVSIEIETPQIEIEKLSKVKGVDVGQRNLAVTQDNKDEVKFYSGGQTLHKANKYSIQIKQLQKKGTRSATRKLVLLSGKERRFKMQTNHTIAKQIVEPNTLIGLENLTHIRERTAKKRRKGKRASKKQRKANANNSKWAFAELHSFIDYKSNVIGSLAIKVDSDYTSQMCVKCGHTSRDNRKNGSVIFKCVCCGYEVHSDLLGSRNVLMRTILVRQDLIKKGAFVNTPNVSDKEAKAERLKRFSELRWSSDTSHHALAGGN